LTTEDTELNENEKHKKERIEELWDGTEKTRYQFTEARKLSNAL